MELLIIKNNKKVLIKNEEIMMPEDIANMTFADYDDFLLKRRKLMENKIKEYYYSL